MTRKTQKSNLHYQKNTPMGYGSEETKEGRNVFLSAKLMDITLNKYEFYVRRRLSAECIDFLDTERAIKSLEKCVCGKSLVQSYLELAKKNKTGDS